MTAPLGPFRLTARILSSPAGVVYAALDPAGRQVQVALLTRGAASDPAARDRFAGAVRGSGAAVLAADTDDEGPWAIGTGNLAGLLEPVLLRGEASRGRGPQFLHHWAGRGEDPAFPTGRREGRRGEPVEHPSFTRAPGSGGWSTDGSLSPGASLMMAVLALIVLALLVLGVVILLVWLLRSQPAELPVEPAPTPTTESASPTPSPSPSGSSGPPTPDPSGTTPAPTGPGTGPTPGPTPLPDDGGDNPL